MEYEKGHGEAKVKTFTIIPVKEYTNKEIREIRMHVGMTQGVFVSFMGGCQRKQWKHGSLEERIRQEQPVGFLMFWPKRMVVFIIL